MRAFAVLVLLSLVACTEEPAPVPCTVEVTKCQPGPRTSTHAYFICAPQKLECRASSDGWCPELDAECLPE